jgi:hypothetical protein
MRCEQGEDDEEVSGESARCVSAERVLSWHWSGLAVPVGVGTWQCVVNPSSAKSPDTWSTPSPPYPHASALSSCRIHIPAPCAATPVHDSWRDPTHR